MARETKPGRGSDQFPLRLPDGMRDRIKGAAARKGVSMNEVIVQVLQERFPAPLSVDVFVSEIRGYLQLLRKAPSTETLGTLAEDLHALLSDIAEGRLKLMDDLATQELVDAYREHEEQVREEQNERWRAHTEGNADLSLNDSAPASRSNLSKVRNEEQ